MTLTNLEVYHHVAVKGMTRTNLEVFHDVAVQPLESQSIFLVLFCFFAALCLVGPLTYCADLQPCRYGLFLFVVPF